MNSIVTCAESNINDFVVGKCYTIYPMEGMVKGDSKSPKASLWEVRLSYNKWIITDPFKVGYKCHFVDRDEYRDIKIDMLIRD